MVPQIVQYFNKELLPSLPPFLFGICLCLTVVSQTPFLFSNTWARFFKVIKSLSTHFYLFVKNKKSIILSKIVPPPVEILTLRTSECNYIWRSGL